MQVHARQDICSLFPSPPRLVYFQQIFLSPANVLEKCLVFMHLHFNDAPDFGLLIDRHTNTYTLFCLAHKDLFSRKGNVRELVLLKSPCPANQ